MTNNSSDDIKIRITQNLTNIPENGFILYSITRKEVESRDISRFLRDLQPGASTSKRDVRNLFGSIVFSYESHQDSADAFEVPGIREHMALINSTWASWLFYAVPVADAFRPMLWCCLQTLRATRRLDSSQVEIVYDINELTRLIVGWMPTAVALADWAGIPRKRIYQRIYHWMVMLLPPEIAKDFVRKTGHLC